MPVAEPVADPLLDRLEVLAVDLQATGADPTRSWPFELAWVAVSAATPGPGAARAEAALIAPPPGAVLPPRIAQLTGLAPRALSAGASPAEAWTRFLTAAAAVRREPTIGAAVAVIHFARFERGFLETLHAHHGGGSLPFVVVCLHEIARRLLPDLPRRGLRALAGFLGHSVGSERRACPHAEATAFVWRRLVERLAAEAGVHRWSELGAFLDAPPPRRSGRRCFPMEAVRRRALPRLPGVYRLLRGNGDVLYVGKATSLRERVSGHFHRGAGASERALEMLSQARDVAVTATATPLEAALLECDTIKRLAPPYNRSLRGAGRAVWFVRRDLGGAARHADSTHVIGPVPHREPLLAVGTLALMASGRAASGPASVARACGLEARFSPSVEVFDGAWASLAREHALASADPQQARAALAQMARVLEREAATAEPSGEEDERVPRADAALRAVWTEERARAHLEQVVRHAARLVRRARWLCWLSESTVAWPVAAEGTRVLVLARGRVDDVRWSVPGTDLPEPPGWRRPLRARRRGLDLAAYDRLRVLTTELRLLAPGARVRLRPGPVLCGEALARVLGSV